MIEIATPRQPEVSVGSLEELFPAIYACPISIGGDTEMRSSTQQY